MNKIDQAANGALRIFNVLAWVTWLLGLLAVYGMNAPRNSYTYTDVLGFIRISPSKPFDWFGFLSGSLIWGVIVLIVYFILIFVSAYILNGFRKTNK